MTKQQKERQVASLRFSYDGFSPYDFKYTRRDIDNRTKRLTQMRKLKAEGITISQIARVYKISRQHASRLLSTHLT